MESGKKELWVIDSLRRLINMCVKMRDKASEGAAVEFWNDMIEAINWAQEYVYRKIPVKMTAGGACPSCKNELFIVSSLMTTPVTACPCCGQALDRSDIIRVGDIVYYTPGNGYAQLNEGEYRLEGISDSVVSYMGDVKRKVTVTISELNNPRVSYTVPIERVLKGGADVSDKEERIKEIQKRTLEKIQAARGW